MSEIVTDIFPPDDSDREQTRKWRRSISYAVLAIGVTHMANLALTWGLVGYLGLFSGFASIASVDAMAHDVGKVQQQLTEQSQQMQRDKNEIKVLLIQGQLAQLFDAWCGAVRGGRPIEADNWERQYTDKVIEYNRISAQPYPMRRCG